MIENVLGCSQERIFWAGPKRVVLLHSAANCCASICGTVSPCRDSCGMCGVFQPALFENIVSETVQHLHEVVVLNKPGEPEVNKCFASHFALRIDHA